MTNSTGSRYIGTIGESGGLPGGMHTHIGYYKNSGEMEKVRAQKTGLKDVEDPKYYLDLKTLVNDLRQK